MIERKFVAENLKEFQIEEYLRSILGKAGISYIKLQRTPLGEKILVCASRPGIIVGKSGSNIAKLTKDLKERFHLENPQIELLEAENPMTDANIVAESIANSLERFGTARFKGIGHKAMSDIMSAGARGVEILISGKVPSSRAKTWRFYMGYLKKSGDIAVSGVNTAYSQAKLKTGIVGVQVRIMPSTTALPDDITYKDPQVQDLTTGKIEKLSQESDESDDRKVKKSAKSEKSEKHATKTSKKESSKSTKSDKHEKSDATKKPRKKAPTKKSEDKKPE
ncbi:MAG: 30S ribosomal protein S3 [Candidatus Woesearchaeota archaeon]